MLRKGKKGENEQDKRAPSAVPILCKTHLEQSSEDWIQAPLQGTFQVALVTEQNPSTGHSQTMSEIAIILQRAKLQPFTCLHSRPSVSIKTTYNQKHK